MNNRVAVGGAGGAVPFFPWRMGREWSSPRQLVRYFRCSDFCPITIALGK